MTVLKHGIFDSTSRREFLQALHEEKRAAMSASVDAHHAGDDGDALRQAALHARLEYKKGARLSRMVQEDNSIYASLSPKNKLLFDQFRTGMLLERRKQADNAYGHGRDVGCLNMREKATLRAWSSNILHEYFNE